MKMIDFVKVFNMGPRRMSDVPGAVGMSPPAMRNQMTGMRPGWKWDGKKWVKDQPGGGPGGTSSGMV